MSFVHLHCHTHFSLLDGLPRPKQYIEKALADGSPALAITDHGNLYGAVEFYSEAKRAGIKPIIGLEAYTAVGSRHSKQSGIDNQIGHLILLARNMKGYQNLMELSSRSHLEGFYYKPRLDWELLNEYSEGLTILSGCLNGDISKRLLANDEEGAVEMLTKFQNMVGKENVYLELQDHPQLLEQGILNGKLLDFSKSTGAPLVATNDCHCLNPEDREAHDILLCVQTGSNILDENRFKIDGGIHMRSAAEMKEAFSHVPEAISNTLVIADQCEELDLQLNTKNILPVYDTPFGKTDKDYLRELCDEGMKERYGDDIPQSHQDRLDYELKIVHEMGFDAYFLIVQDFVNYAKNSGILVGPGRGSAAGAIIAYVLKITDVDPMRYGLLFERFLNPARVSMPDIDIDFADNRREEVLQYVVEKYGKEKVAQIITFGTMAAKAAVRDVGRGLGMAYGDVDVVSKLIPGRPGIKLAEALEEEPQLKAQYKVSPQVKKLIDLAMKLEGVVRHVSVHACAVVIADKPLTQYTPLQLAPGNREEETVITQYDMHHIESIGLLKMDFLGLKNLTILGYALEIIRRTHGVDIDLEKLPLDDEETFKLMARGETTGVFQFESAGMRRYLKQLKPTQFEDLIAMNALYRPGPMDWIPSYIKGKHNPKKVKYFHPSFESILKETYGVAIYQEQILQLAQLVAGFSLGEADILRKAVGKKIIKLLNEQRVKFVEGAVGKGHKAKFAEEVFSKVIEPFAGYGFNKAHATCYAMIAYRTAYLKSHYPAEFMAALMTSDRDNTERIVIEINESNAMGIEVLPPSINESMANFTVIDEHNIRFGLAAIKGVGIGTVREILAVREKGGPFKSIEDFAKRVPYKLINKKTLEALSYCGAFDELGERKSLVSSIEQISSYARNSQTLGNENQVDIFSMLSDDKAGELPPLKLAKVPEANHMQRLTWEKQYLGLYVSGHPLQGLTRYLQRKAATLSSLTAKSLGKEVRVAGILTAVKKVSTKSGSQMAYMTLEDVTGRIEVIVFPKTFMQFKALFEPESVVVITGKLDQRRGDVQLVCRGIQGVSLQAMINRAKDSGLYDPSEKVMAHTAISLDMSEVESKDSKDSVDEVVKKESVKAAPVPRAIPSPPPGLSDPSIPLVISVHSSDMAALKSLKSLLLRHQGKQEVEIHIPQNGLVKRIKVPFGVKVTPELKTQIAQLAQVQ